MTENSVQLAPADWQLANKDFYKFRTHLIEK
jgi:hypothetical protein